MSETWLVLGASSGLARAFVRAAATRGYGVALAGRDTGDLARSASDAALRGAPEAQVVAFDVRDPDLGALGQLFEAGVVHVAVFVGAMPPQAEIDAEPDLIAGVVTDNFAGPARVLHALAPALARQGTGFVVGVGSVAGDRGRLPNYVYGAAKAGFHTYLAGLRNRLGRAGVHVMTVKPGVVDTGMTWGLEGLPTAAAPEAVAEAMFAGLDRRRNVIYAPWIWAPIMGVIRLIPERIFKRLSF